MKKELKNLMIDCATGVVNNYSVAQNNEAIRKQFHEVLGTTEDSSRKEIRKAIRKHKSEVFELIEETVEALLEIGFADTEFYKRVVEMRNLAAGDTNEFFVPANTILTMSEFSGGHHDIERQRFGIGKTFAVKTSWYGIKVYEEFELFMAGRIDWAGYIQKLYKALDRTVNNMIVEAFLGIESFVPTAFALSGSVDEDKVLDIVEKVEVANGGNPVMIVGTRAALAKLAKMTNANMWSEQMKDERNTTGLLGTWVGIDALRLPQAMKADGTTLAVPQNKLFLLPMVDEKPIKIVQEGDTVYFENTEGAVNRDMTVEAELMTKMGVATVVGGTYGVITLAS